MLYNTDIYVRCLLRFVFAADQLGSQFWDHLYRKNPAAELDEQDTNCGKCRTQPAVSAGHNPR